MTYCINAYYHTVMEDRTYVLYSHLQYDMIINPLHNHYTSLVDDIKSGNIIVKSGNIIC